MKNILIFICLLFVGCASTVSTANEFDRGLPTLENLMKGEMNLACDDAHFLVNLLNSQNKVIFKYSVIETVYPETIDKYSEADKKFIKLIEKEYLEFYDRILTPFINNKDAYAKVLSTVVDTDIANVFSACFMNYLGLMDNKQVNEYIKVSFCKEQRSQYFISPRDIDVDEFRAAVKAKANEF